MIFDDFHKNITERFKISEKFNLPRVSQAFNLEIIFLRTLKKGFPKFDVSILW